MGFAQVETIEIQNNLQRIDSSFKSLCSESRNIIIQIDDYKAKMNYCQQKANAILFNVTDSDDYSRMNEAREYSNKADVYKNMIYDLERRRTQINNEIHGYLSQYEYYKNECEVNIQKLETVIDKLNEVSKSKYGSSTKQVLTITRQKIEINNRYRDGCISRINLIQQICVMN